MRVHVIEEKLEKIVDKHNIQIHSIKTKREFNEKVLEILLKGENLNTDLLAKIHLELYESLEDGDLDEDYFLELSSVGAEYPLNSLEEIKNHIGTYVIGVTNEFKIIGYLIEVKDDIVTIEYNAKGQFRKMKIEYDKFVSIETRVKV